MTRECYNQLLVSSEIGGAGAVALQISRALSSEGRRAPVWIPGVGAAETEARRLGLDVKRYSVKSAKSQMRIRAGLGNLMLAVRLRSCGPGLIHVHGVNYYGLLWWGLQRCGLKRVVHVQIEEAPEAIRWSFRTPPELIITCARFLVDHVRKALPPEQQDRQWIAAVPNAVDTDRFKPADKAYCKKAVGAPDMPLVLMLANLAPHKGQETAIRSIAILKQRGVDMACWLAGMERQAETGYTVRLRELIEALGVGDRVRLLGQRCDAPDLLGAADYFLLPSTHEGLPLSILEAQACKVPVLAAPTAGIPEVVRDGETGFLIAASDAAGYADRLQSLSENTEQIRPIVDAAYRHVHASHTWPTYCRRIEELYRELLTGTKPADCTESTEERPRFQAAAKKTTSRRQVTESGSMMANSGQRA
jgi:glycosyltransferase involved in cell wall biosynthesis